MGHGFDIEKTATTGEGRGGLRSPWLRRLVTVAVLFLLTGIAALSAFAAGGDVIWQYGDTAAGKQEAKASAVDSQGNTIITGYQNLSGGVSDDFLTTKIKGDGSGVAWRAVFDKSGGSDQATAIVIDSDDNVIVTGYVWNGLNNDVHTVKYDGSTGAIIWQHTFNGAASGNDVGTSIAVDSLNNVYVGGYSQDGTGNFTFLVLKYSPTGPNPDGKPVWQAIADGATTGINRVNSIAAGSGGVVVTGQTWNGTAFDILTVKFDYSGAKQWERRYSTGAANSCFGKYTKIDTTGNVVMTGAAFNGVDLDIYTAKYNGSTGDVLWEKTYNGAFDDEPNGLVIGPNGNVYLTGYTWTLSAQNDFYTAKYNGATGALIWEKTFNSENGNDDITAATGIVVDPVGDVFVTGYTIYGKNFDFQTIKYKKDNGNQLWQKSFDGTASKNDRPIGIGLSPTGEVLVAGWTDTAANDLDYYVIKYDPGLLNPPTDVRAQALTNNSIQLTWVDNSANEDGFSIERCQNAGCTAFVEIATTVAGVTSYTDNSLSSASYYSYRIRAFSGTAGYSHYSNTATALTVVVNFVPPVWTYVLNGLANSDDFANSIAVGPDNNPVVAGQSNDFPVGYTSGPTSFDYLLVKLNRATMGVVWSDRYNDPTDASDVATAVAVDSDNGVVVSGYATLFNGSSNDVNSLYTIRYPAAGPPALRSDQYNGPVAGGATDDRAVAVAIASASDTSNNVVVVGYGKNASDNFDIYVLKYNPDGTRAWAATPFDGNGGDDYPTSVVLALDGSIYVSGYTETAANSNKYNFFTARYNGSTGARIWTDIYSVTAGGDNRGAGLVLDTAGDLYVTGYAITSAGNKDIYTIKYKGGSTSVQRLWERSFDGIAHGDDEGVSVAIDVTDNAVVVAGTTLSGTDDHDFTMIRYSQAGDTIWAKTYQRPTSDDNVKAMGVDADGNIYVAGNTGNGTSTDSLTVKFDYLANIVSATIYNGTANSFDESTALVINRLNEVFVAGYTENASGNADYLVYKIAPDATLPSVPYAVAAVPGYASVALTWLDRSAVKDGFRIERKVGSCSTTNANPWEALATLPVSPLAYADSGLNSGATYCYRIQTFLNNGTVSRWMQKEATTLTPPAPGTISATAVNSTRITINWSDTTSSETGFRLERCAGSGCSDFSVVTTTAANTTTYTDNTVCGGTAYRYRVLSYGPGWESPSIALTGVVTTVTPAAPVLTATRISEAEIDLAWTDPNGDETGYVVERCIGSGCTGFTPFSTLAANSTSFKDTGLTAGTTYVYRIKGYKTENCSWEVFSAAAEATATLNPPSGLTATPANTTRVNLAWTDNTVSETGFTIEKCVGSGCVIFNPLDSVGPNVTSYADLSACNGETATYRVKATREAVTLSNSGGSCWTRRTPFSISNFQPNFQMKVTVPYDSDMQGTFADIRFVDTYAGLEIPYWIESMTEGVSATVWLKTGMNNSVAMYFGNGSATSSSNGVKVFEFFDEFNGGSLDTAAWNATGAYSLTGGALRVDTGAVYSKATVAATPQNRVFEMKSQWLTGASSYSGLNISNAQSTLGSNAGSNALTYFVTDSGTTANLLPFAANGSTASYNIASGTLSTTVSTSGALYNPFVSNGQYTRKPASGVWSPTGGGNITKIHVQVQSERNYDYFYVYNAAGTLLGTYNGSVDQWVDVAPTTGIYTYFRTDGSVQSGFGGDVPEVVVDGISAVNALNNYRIIGYEFRDTTQISYFVKELNYTDVLRKTYSGTWGAAPYLWLGYYTGAAAGASDGDDMLVDWVRVRKYAATEPVATFGGKETSACFTFGSPWDGTFTNTASAVTPTPSTPVLSATRASEAQINLTWTDTNADRSGFSLERCSGAGCSNFAVIAASISAASTSYNDTGLTPDTSYTYRLTVFKTATCGWTKQSNTATAVTTLYEPNNVVATTNNTTQITLNWTDRTGSETGFSIERCQGSGCTSFAQITPSAAANATSYADTGVCEGQPYRYQIRATNGTWYSIYSTPPAAATTTTAFAPTLTATSPSEAQINITWNDPNSDESGYRLERCVGASCSSFTTLVTQGPGVTSYNDIGVTPGTSYTYRVVAFKNATCSWAKPSNSVTIVPQIAGPTSLTATSAGTAQINLAWTRTTTSETGFKVERCLGVNCSDFLQVGTATAGSTTYNDTSVCSGLTYRYQVRATNSTVPWDSSYSNIATGITTTSTNLLADPGFENATTSWATAVGVLTGTSFDTTTMHDGAKSLKLAAGGVNLGRSQSITVTPGRQYVLSGWLNTALTAGTAQCDVSGTGLDSPGLSIAYNSSNNNTGWVNLSETVTIPAGTTSVSIRCFADGAPQGTAYFDSISFAPADFTLTASRVSETQINLSWPDSVVDETGYKIERCSGAGCSNFVQIGTAAANATSFSNTGLTAGTTYRYQIRGYKTATCGWDGSYSSIAEAVTTIAAPTGLAATAANTTQINLNWTDNTVSETGFRIERCQGSGCSNYTEVGTTTTNVTTYSDSSVASGTLYQYQVRATNSTLSWNSPYSTPASATTPTPAAGVLTATAQTESKINLSWTDLTSDESGFKVERCTGSGCSNFVQIGTNLAANTTSYSDTTGLTSGNTYTYRVSAFKTATGGWTVTSNTAEATTTPPAPTSLAVALNNTTQVTLTWTNKTTSETGISIERCQGSGCSDFAPLATVGTGVATYSDQSLCNNQPYSYRVRAINTIVPWNTDYSNIVSATTVVPTAPTLLSVVRVDETKLNLSWTDNTADETGFKIERCAGVGCSNFVQVGTSGVSVKTFSDTGLSGGITYRYQVRAYKTPPSGCPWDSGYTNIAEAVTTVAVPTGLTATAPNSTQINLAWTNNTVSETGYRVERCAGASCSNFAEITVVSAKVAAWSDTTVASGTTYRYQIRATNSTVPWDSGYSNIASATTTAQTAPGMLAPTVMASRVTLAWSDNTVDETGFRIEKCQGDGCADFAEIAQVGANITTYADTTVCSGTPYSYRVRATKSTVPTFDTAYSSVVSVTPAVTAPTLTATRSSEIQINLSWNDPTTDEEGYRVERCIGAGCSDFTQIAALASNVISYSDTGLLPNYTYVYRVKGYNATATCPWVSASVPVSAITTTVAPTGLTATAAGMGQINLSWSDSSVTKTGFRIERCTGAGCTNFNEVATTTGSGTTWSDLGLASGTSYSYRVRATKTTTYAWDSEYSAIASATTGAVPAAPTSLTAVAASASQINLTWSDSAVDASGYKIESCSGSGCSNFSEIASVAVTPKSYSHTGLNADSSHCYRVRGYKSGTGAWTSDYSAVTCAATAIDSPASLTATAVNSVSIKLTWNESSADVSGFNLEGQIWNGEWVVVASLGADATSYTDTIGIEPLKTYAYRIRSFKGAQYSSYSTPASATTPAYNAVDAPCSDADTTAPIITSTPVTTAVEGVAYSYQVTATVTAGRTLSYSLARKPDGMSISASGLVSWTPAYNQSGDQNVTVRVTDSAAHSTEQHFIITIGNSNRAPSIISTPVTVAFEQHPYSYQVTATDPEGDQLTYTLTTAPAGMTISGSGQISWTPTSGQYGNNGVVVRVSDGMLSADQSFSVNVAHNQAPVITSTPSTTAGEGSPYTYQLLASDPDGDSIGYSLSVAPAGMTVTSTGLVTWVPNVIQAQAGANNVTVQVSDGFVSTPQSFTINVTQNHAPVIPTTPVTTAAENSAYSYAVAATDADGDTLNYTLTGAPAGMTISAAGVINWLPSYTQAGSYTLTVRATDPRGLYAEKTFTITVADVRRPITITSTPVTTVNVGATYTYQVTATDPDSSINGYSLTVAPAGMTISGTGLISWVPTSDNPSVAVTVRVSDPYQSANQSYSIDVHGPPAVPVPVHQVDYTSNCASTALTLTWSAVTAPRSHGVQYAVLLNNVQQSWQSGTSFSFNAAGSYTWFVKAKDIVTGVESVWSAADVFYDTACCDCTCDNSCGSSSCPLVYSWDGTGYHYETDLQGPAISQIKKPGRYVNLYQPSYIVLENLVADVNNQYRVKIWESLQESSLVDEVKLLAVDYPEGYQIVSSGAENTYYYKYVDPFRIYTIKDPVLPMTATDKYGNNILTAVSNVDNNPAPMAPNDPDNFYTFDFGTIQHPEYAKLVIDGWQDINSKIYLSTITIQPYIEVVDATGGWVKVKSFGMPAGDLKTMVIDIGNVFLSSDHRIRLHLGIKKAQVWVFDRIRLDDSAPVSVTTQEVQASFADLQVGGHAIQSMVNRDHRLIATDEVQPLKPDYYGYGNFTRYGNVGPLVTQRDDKYVVMNYADKLDMKFPAPLPPQPGMKRGFILKVDNYYKEFKEYKYVEPLPFHGMTDYPYTAPEAYPTDADHEQYRMDYNTRIVAP